MSCIDFGCSLQDSDSDDVNGDGKKKKKKKKTEKERRDREMFCDKPSVMTPPVPPLIPSKEDSKPKSESKST